MNLADSYVEIGGYQKAIELLQSIDDGKPDVSYALGRAYLYEDNYKDALKILQLVPSSFNHVSAQYTGVRRLSWEWRKVRPTLRSAPPCSRKHPANYVRGLAKTLNIGRAFSMGTPQTFTKGTQSKQCFWGACIKSCGKAKRFGAYFAVLLLMLALASGIDPAGGESSGTISQRPDSGGNLQCCRPEGPAPPRVSHPLAFF